MIGKVSDPFFSPEDDKELSSVITKYLAEIIMKMRGDPNLKGLLFSKVDGQWILLGKIDHNYLKGQEEIRDTALDERNFPMAKISQEAIDTYRSLTPGQILFLFVEINEDSTSVMTGISEKAQLERVFRESMNYIKSSMFNGGFF